MPNHFSPFTFFFHCIIISQDTPHPKTQEKVKEGSTERGSRLPLSHHQTNSSLHKLFFTFNLFPSASFFPSLHLFSFGLFRSCTLQIPLFNPLFLLHPSSPS
ncbi:hypothetical protein VNO80_02741 [Phaseolus coccineus]|uniref:Uncharacterized protein n=1 Tax=Phaseolus coccineus TaxID=3886 RepID=A0AAN9NXE7_PHACN